MPRQKEIIPGQNAPQDYVFNETTGWPSEVNEHVNELLKEWKDKPLTYSQHANERGQMNDGKHGVNIGQITNNRFPDVMKGFRPVEVSHNGKDVTKMVMRGPLSGTHDAVIPIVRSQNGLPHSTTAWSNEKTDGHNSLDLNRVHLPEEFKKGKPPRRRLAEDWQTKQPGYQSIPHNSMKSRQRIIDKFGHKGSPAQTQEQVLPQYQATSVANYIDYEKLRFKLNSARPIFFEEFG